MLESMEAPSREVRAISILRMQLAPRAPEAWLDAPRVEQWGGEVVSVEVSATKKSAT
jgi:hypothetical protein